MNIKSQKYFQDRPMTDRRRFLQTIIAAPSAAVIAPSLLTSANWVPPAPRYQFPRLTFYGATRQVSGSCHLLETSHGLYLVDCGSFISDVDDPDKENRELPFDPQEVQAVLLTHAHADHLGRLPLLYKRGFRGKIYCTDATRDITMLALGGGPLPGDNDPLFSEEDAKGTLGLLEAVPYNTKIEADKLTVRFTEAGHILGSAMIEVWVDNRKILFSGDMGPENAPILIPPAQHFFADAVLVESTYGPVPRSEIDYNDFGRKIMEVIDRGGNVLLPTFAIHKSQILLFTIQRLVKEGVISADVPIYCDSSTVHRGNLLYDTYDEYHDQQAREFREKHGSLFYLGKYREGQVRDFIKAHGGTPSVFVSTSGMLAFAASPRHLQAMARDPKNAVLIPGYQAPRTVGRQLLDGEKSVRLNIDDGNRREVTVDVRLQVDRVSGFSSHATGEEILEWISKFEQIGDVYVVHGEERSSTGLAEKISQMKVNGYAPKRDESFTVKRDRVKPGRPPKLERRGAPPAPAAVDQ